MRLSGFQGGGFQRGWKPRLRGRQPAASCVRVWLSAMLLEFGPWPKEVPIAQGVERVYLEVVRIDLLDARLPVEWFKTPRILSDATACYNAFPVFGDCVAEEVTRVARIASCGLAEE